MISQVATRSTPIRLPASEQVDYPLPGLSLTVLGGPLQLPAIVYGAGTFSYQYNTDEHIASSIPVRTVRLALRYGIRAFDTSAYYGPSEVVLGNTLQALKDEFPRSSYTLMTKCGRYGLADFDYSPVTIRNSVKLSLERLKTDYLDVIYLHDVEFVCDQFAPGSPSNAVREAAYGLNLEDEGKVRGSGDQRVLVAFSELRQLKKEGVVKQIGITGYPLPTLLRLAIMILKNPPYEPIDILLSYSHLCLQNSAFSEFLPRFKEQAKIKTLLAASPLSMGLLTSTPPDWHPAPPTLRAAVVEATQAWEGKFSNLALGYSISLTGLENGNVPLVVGFSTPQEVHECMKVWREIQEIDDEGQARRKEGEQQARNIFQRAGFLDWSWPSP